MNDADIVDGLVETAYSYASNYLLGTNRELLSMFLLRKTDGTNEIIGTPWANKKEERQMIYAVCERIMASEPPVFAFSLLSEVWMAFRAFDDPMIPAGECPNRRQAISCMASDGTTRRFQAWQIGRDAQGRCVSLAGEEKPREFNSWIIDALDNAMAVAWRKSRPRK